MTLPSNRHPCPGCRIRITRNMRACHPCWQRLPADLKVELANAHQALQVRHTSANVGANRRAVNAARTWWANHEEINHG